MVPSETVIRSRLMRAMLDAADIVLDTRAACLRSGETRARAAAAMELSALRRAEWLSSQARTAGPARARPDR